MLKRLLVSLAAVTLAAFATAFAFSPQHVPPEPARPARTIGATSEPRVAIVTGGDAAPDVSWQTTDGKWTRLSRLRVHGAVLLVFARRDADLTKLQQERDALLDLDVLPVVVVDRRAGATNETARRLGLTYTLVPDPLGVLAGQFNALDPDTRALSPAWFVIDRRGVVRGLDHGDLPTGNWSGICATALALPRPGVALPSSTR